MEVLRLDPITEETIKRQVNAAYAEVVANILDERTDAGGKWKIIIDLTFEGKGIDALKVAVTVKTKLLPAEPVETLMQMPGSKQMNLVDIVAEESGR